MRSTVQKWGNSLALRLPKPFAREIGIEQGTPVEVSIDDGRLVIARAKDQSITLDQMLKKVSRKNMHTEVTTGPAVGREAW